MSFQGSTISEQNCLSYSMLMIVLPCKTILSIVTVLLSYMYSILFKGWRADLDMSILQQNFGMRKLNKNKYCKFSQYCSCLYCLFGLTFTTNSSELIERFNMGPSVFCCRMQTETASCNKKLAEGHFAKLESNPGQSPVDTGMRDQDSTN